MYTLNALIPSIGHVTFDVVYSPDGENDVDVEISNIRIWNTPVVGFPFLQKLLEKNAKLQWKLKYKDWYNGELADMYKIMYSEWQPE